MKRERLPKAERLARRQPPKGGAREPWQEGSFWFSSEVGESGRPRRLERAEAAARSYDVAQLAALMHAYRRLDLGEDGTTPDGYTRSTARTYEAGIRRWTEYAAQHGVDLLSPPADLMLVWLREMEGRYSPSTVGTYLAGVRRLYGALRRVGASDVTPLAHVRVKKDVRAAWERRQKYETGDAARLIEHARAQGNAALAFALSLGIDAGLRASEIVGVRYGDVDVAAGLVRVSRAKREKSRQVALLPRGLRLFGELSPAPRTAFVYPHTARWLRQQLSALCAAAGVPYLALHSLRHSHGTLLGERGVPLTVLAAQMGHDVVASSAPYIKPGNVALVHQMVAESEAAQESSTCHD